MTTQVSELWLLLIDVVKIALYLISNHSVVLTTGFLSLSLMASIEFYGVYDMAYSPKNRHLFARTEVCCTCGFEGADSLECGRYGSKNITISGEMTEGQCGRHCQGGSVDTIGVIEFDTTTDTIVGTHQFVGSAPVYAPFSSPDGEHIILFGLNGGQTVDILKAGENGQQLARSVQCTNLGKNKKSR